jgi:hypothetical protein
MVTRYAIAIWLIAGGTIAGYMATSGTQPAVAFAPLHAAIVGGIEAVIVGAIAGLVARLRRIPRRSGWPWAAAGAGIGFGFGAEVGVIFEPAYVHATHLAFVVEISAVAIGGVALATASFLLLSPGVSADSTSRGASRVAQTLGVVVGIGFPIAFTAFVASGPSNHFYDPSLPTISISITGSTMTFDPTSVRAGPVNLVLTQHGATCQNNVVADELGVHGVQLIVVNGAEPNTTSMLPPTAPGPGAGGPASNPTPLGPNATAPTGSAAAPAVVFLPTGDVVDYPDDGALVLDPGTITWSCGTAYATTQAH